jgi:hypothetical protein
MIPEMSRCDAPFILTASSWKSMIAHRFVEALGVPTMISMRANRIMLGVLGAGLTATSACALIAETIWPERIRRE